MNGLGRKTDSWTEYMNRQTDDHIEQTGGIDRTDRQMEQVKLMGQMDR